LKRCPKLLRSSKPSPTRPSGLHLAGNIKLVPIYHPCTGCGVMLSPMSLLYYQLYECSSYQLYLTLTCTLQEHRSDGHTAMRRTPWSISLTDQADAASRAKLRWCFRAWSCSLLLQVK
jgi:hypothetical protein